VTLRINGVLGSNQHLCANLVLLALGAVHTENDFACNARKMINVRQNSIHDGRLASFTRFERTHARAQVFRRVLETAIRLALKAVQASLYA
jgi:hypothetical protein